MTEVFPQQYVLLNGSGCPLSQAIYYAAILAQKLKLIYEIFLIGIVLKNKGPVVSSLNYVVYSAILFFSGPASHKNTPLIILPGGGRFCNNLVT